MLDHQKNYHNYLDAMKLLHVPLHTPSKLPELPESQPIAPPVATGTVTVFISHHLYSIYPLLSDELLLCQVLAL